MDETPPDPVPGAPPPSPGAPQPSPEEPQRLADASRDDPAPPPAYGGFTPTEFHPTVYSPHQSQPPAEPARSSRRGGLAGALAAVVAALAKFGGIALGFLAKGGFLVLKFVKLGGTALSMLISLWFYVLLFGPLYGIGLLVLIAIHESGHMVFGRLEGVPTSWPIFLGPFGAFVTPKGEWNRRQEAVMAVGGPVFGIAASFACYLIGLSLPNGRTHFLLIALAYFGCFLNLFNLVPFSPLDGGRVAGAVSPRANVVGLVLLFAFFLVTGTTPLANPFLLIIIVFGVLTTYQRLRAARAGTLPPPLPAATRVTIAFVYLTVIVMALLGMSAAHAQLVDAGYARRI